MERHITNIKESNLRKSTRKAQRELLTSGCNMEALEYVRNPQAWAERLFKDLRQSRLIWEGRRLQMELVSRVVGTQKLLLPNFYSFLQRYLFPKTKGYSFNLRSARREGERDRQRGEQISNDNFVLLFISQTSHVFCSTLHNLLTTVHRPTQWSQWCELLPTILSPMRPAPRLLLLAWIPSVRLWLVVHTLCRTSCWKTYSSTLAIVIAMSSRLRALWSLSSELSTQVVCRRNCAAGLLVDKVMEMMFIGLKRFFKRFDSFSKQYLKNYSLLCAFSFYSPFCASKLLIYNFI